MGCIGVAAQRIELVVLITTEAHLVSNALQIGFRSNNGFISEQEYLDDLENQLSLISFEDSDMPKIETYDDLNHVLQSFGRGHPSVLKILLPNSDSLVINSALFVVMHTREIRDISIALSNAQWIID